MSAPGAPGDWRVRIVGAGSISPSESREVIVDVEVSVGIVLDNPTYPAGAH